MNQKVLINFSIVVPLYNEAQNIDELIKRLKASISSTNLSYELILVNDGSTDDTSYLLKKHSEDMNIQIINLIKNYGQSIAIRAGIENSKGLYIICIDGDLQHKPEVIPQITEYLLRGYDLVSFYKNSKKNRRPASKIAHKLISKISKTNLQYYGISIKGFCRELIDTRDLFGNTHRYIGISLAQKTHKIKELPIEIAKRENGKSNYQSKYWSVFWELFSIKLLFKDVSALSKYYRKTGFFIGFLSFLGIGISIGFDVFADFNISQDFIIEFIFLNFLLVIGILFFILGIALQIYQRESIYKPYIIKKQ